MSGTADRAPPSGLAPAPVALGLRRNPATFSAGAASVRFGDCVELALVCVPVAREPGVHGQRGWWSLALQAVASLTRLRVVAASRHAPPSQSGSLEHIATAGGAARVLARVWHAAACAPPCAHRTAVVVVSATHLLRHSLRLGRYRCK